MFNQRSLPVFALVVTLAAAAWYFGSLFCCDSNSNNNDKVGAVTAQSPGLEVDVSINQTETCLASALDVCLSYEERLAALAYLPDDLSSERQQKLLALVQMKRTHPTLRNDAMSALERQQEKLPDLGTKLIAMFEDTNEDRVWRDYCLQHLAAVYAFSVEERGQIEKLLTTVAAGINDGGKGNLAGTALISLRRIAEKFPELRATAGELSAAALQGDKLDEEKAVTALQTAADGGDVSVLPEARRLANDAKILARLRLSAMGAIGRLGEAEDLQLLDRLTRDTDKRIRVAAEVQRVELSKRLETQAAGDKTAQLVSMNNKPNAAQVAAGLRLAAKSGDVTALPEARKLATEAGVGLEVRLAAIAALGALGEAEDAAVLDKLSRDKVKSLREPAAAGLETLRLRVTRADANK